jgi:hypothetical protein
MEPTNVHWDVWMGRWIRVPKQLESLIGDYATAIPAMMNFGQGQGPGQGPGQTGECLKSQEAKQYIIRPLLMRYKTSSRDVNFINHPVVVQQTNLIVLYESTDNENIIQHVRIVN